MPRSSRRSASSSGFGDSVQQTLQRISQLGQSGKLAEAEQQCRKLLQQHPNQADAWHLLSVICLQQGQPEQGL
ncbi:MAG: tetratricopeptide repeat protein, partial [Elainella sp.]